MQLRLNKSGANIQNLLLESTNIFNDILCNMVVKQKNQ